MATVHKVSIKADLDAQQAQTQAQKLHDTIKKTKQEAAGIHVPGVGTNVPKSALSPGANRAKENTEYGISRTMRTGTTGASARDFAQQAEGLGGLVRLYATYAANLFAVSAAYTALSKAQDTANMVKGLNQLGAASGVALGSLSKQLVKATDGAVSLREAMEATVKASASGMSSKDILRMGEVAKKAAQALGVDMSDALSRISRGITKLEPELLDELGIFTRIDPAVQAYAKSVGKSVSALTQFERQMAFSNAVLAEGEAKFSEINIQTNAYTQLLAILKDTATAVGNALNTVLVPIIGILSSNPSALFVMLTGMAAMIVKQAIPAFADLNQSMRDNQEMLVAASANRVKLMQAEQTKMKNVAAEAAKSTFKAYIKDADDAAEAAVSSLGKAQSRLETLKKSKVTSQAAPVQSVLATEDLTKLTTKQITDLESYAAKLSRLNKKNAVEVQDLAVAARSVYDTHVQYGKAQKMQAAAASKAAAEEESKLKSTLHYRAANMQLQRESIALQKNLTIAAAGENVQIKGIAGAWREVNASISDYNKQREKGSGLAVEGDRQISRTQANIIKLGAGFSILTGVISSATSAIAPWIEAIGLVIIALGFIDMWLDKAAESVGKFNDSVSASIDATKNLSSVVDRYAGAKIDEAFSVKAVEAYSASLINVADSFDSIEKNAEKARKKLDESAWSSAKNSIKEFFGFGIAGGEKDAIKLAVESLLVSVKKSPAALTNLNKALSETFGIKSTSNVQELEEAINKLYADPATREQLVRIVRATGVELGIAASAQKEFKAAIDKAADASKALGDSLKFSSPMLDLADAGITALEKLAKTGSTVNDQFDSLNSLFEKSKSLDLFGDSVFTAQELGKELENIRKIYKDNTEAIKLAEAEVSKLQKTEDALTAQYGDIRGGNKSADAAVESATKARQDAETQLRLLNSQAKEAVSAINSLFTKAVAASKNGLDGYYAILEKQITIALSAPLNAFKNAVTSTLGNVKGVADREASVALADIGYQKAQLEVELDGILYLRRIAAATELLQANTAADIARRTLGGESATASRDALNAAIKRETDAKAKFDLVSKTNPDPKALLNLARETADPEMRKLASIVTGVTQKLAALGDQAGAVRFTQGFKRVSEGFIDETRSSINKQKDSARELEDIELLKQRQGFLTSEQLLTAEKLSIEKINLDTQVARLALVREEAEIQYIINNGKLTKTEIEEQQNRAQDIALAKQRLADSESTKTELERLKFAKERDAKLQKEITQKYTLLGIQEDIRAQEASASINVLGTSIGVQKDLGIDTGAQDLFLEQMQQQVAFDAARNSAALEFNRTLEQRTSTYSTLGELEKEAYAEETAAITAKYLAITAGEAAAKTAADARLVVQQQILEVAREQELATLRIGSASESLAAVFGSVGEAAGSLLETFTSISQRRENDATKEAELKEIIRSNTASKKEQAAAEKDLSNLKVKSAIQEQKDNISLISGTKKMFKEKTFAYKALSAIEKVMHIQKMFAMAIELKTMLVNLGTSIAAAVTGATAVATAHVPGVFASFMAWLGPWGMAAAAAALAAIGLSGGGGGGPTFKSAEELQETQGTGGVLGDDKAINRDITVGIESLNKLTFLGFNTSQSMLNELEKIQYNTQGMTAGLYRIPGLMGGKSGFGTVEKSNPGFLGLFAKSTAIIDTGVKFLKGQFQQYETVQTTKSGFLGIGGGTKTSQNVRALDEQVNKDLNRVFEDLLTTAGKSLENLGLGLGSTLTPILKGLVDLEGLTISLKGLNAEQASEAISGVLGNTVSLAIQEMYPFLEEFRNVGEGMLATALRVGAEMDYVNKAMKHTGMNFNLLAVQQADLVQYDLKAIDTAKKAKEDALKAEIEAKKKLSEVGKFTVGNEFQDDSYVEDTGQSAAYEAAKQAQIDATDAYTVALKGSGGATQVAVSENIKMTQALIKGAGGIEKFVEQTNFFADNFMTQAEKSIAAQQLYTDQVIDTNKQLKGVGISAGITEAQFADLVRAQDLTTEAGRENWQLLMDLAPAYKAASDAAREHIDAIASSASRWQEIQNLRDPNSGDASQIQSSINAAFKKYLLTDKYGITNARQFLTIGENDFKSNYTAEQQGYILEMIKGFQDLGEVGPASIEKINNQLKAEYNKLIKIHTDLAQKYKTERAEHIKTRDTLTQSIDKMRKFAQSLRDFNANLLLSTESTLTPAQKYQEALQQFASLYEKAKSGDEDAQSKIQSSAQALLSASREMYSSSSAYTADFNYVYSVLDSLALQAESKASVESLTLKGIEDQIALLDNSIKLLEDQSEYLKDQIALIEGTNYTLDQINANIAALLAKRDVTTTTTTPATATFDVKKPDYTSTLGAQVAGNTVTSKIGTTIDKEEGISIILDYAANIDKGTAGHSAKNLKEILYDQWGIDSGMLGYLLKQSSQWIEDWFYDRDKTLFQTGRPQSITEFKPVIPKNTVSDDLVIHPNDDIPWFDIGTNYVPEDMTARIHKGERIIPAADNTRLMNALENKELIKHIQELNTRIEGLEQTVAQGAMMNVDATNRNTDEIARSVKDAGSTASHNEALRRRVSIK